MTVSLLARRIDQHFQRNHLCHALASELSIKVGPLRECFAGNDSLPSPTAKITAAWNDLPNALTDNLPMSMKAKWIFLPAPPPTPTGIDFDENDTISSESFKINHDCWAHAGGADTPTPDAAGFRTPRCSTASNDGSTSRCNQPDQPPDRQGSEEPSFQSTDSSDPGSSSSGGPTSMGPVVFWKVIDQWLLEYRASGAEAFIQTLIAFSVESMATAQVAAQIARAIIYELRPMEGRSLERAIRLTVLATFKKCWSNDIQTTEASARTTTASASPYDLHLVSFIGSLFMLKVADVRDIHVCLSLLSKGEKSLDRLCVMHALLAQAGDRLCKRRYLSTLLKFQHRLASRDEASGEYLWAKTPFSKKILADIIAIIERWMVTQSIKRDQSQPSFCSIAARRRAVGPRLRNTRVPPREQYWP